MKFQYFDYANDFKTNLIVHLKVLTIVKCKFVIKMVNSTSSFKPNGSLFKGPTLSRTICGECFRFNTQTFSNFRKLEIFEIYIEKSLCVEANTFATNCSR